MYGCDSESGPGQLEFGVLVRWNMAVAGSQTSKKVSSLAAEDDSALSGLEGVALFCLRLELAAIDHAGRNG